MLGSFFYRAAEASDVPTRSKRPPRLGPQRRWRLGHGAARVLGALPPNPQDLPHNADPVGKENEAKHFAPPHPTVFGPATALGALPSVALSSERAVSILPQKTLAPGQTNHKPEILSLQMAHETGA